LQAIEVKEKKLRCTCCGEKYPPAEMHTPDTCNDCAEMHQGISIRPAKHKEKENDRIT
jgi:Zn finger protein HypA/HybF involved in hydrogenase expression